jgi:hypothetical protein
VTLLAPRGQKKPTEKDESLSNSQTQRGKKGKGQNNPPISQSDGDRKARKSFVPGHALWTKGVSVLKASALSLGDQPWSVARKPSSPTDLLLVLAEAVFLVF